MIGRLIRRIRRLGTLSEIEIARLEALRDVLGERASRAEIPGIAATYRDCAETIDKATRLLRP